MIKANVAICTLILTNIYTTLLTAAAQTFTKSHYEQKYNTKLEKLKPDEVINEPLKKFAYGSCQRTYPQLKDIYNTIFKYDPDIFFFTGDNFYTEMNCCDERCIERGYLKMINFPPFQEFKKKIKKFDGVYDDHDYGINDGDATFKFKKFAQQTILDFFEKPKDHYRRKRKGVYFSLSYIDPENPNNHVKIIALDLRYHRGCMYNCICQLCGLTYIQSRLIMLRRFFNYTFGIGCKHDADVLGEEQWKWFESQLVDSEARSHVIVSSFQVFTHHPMGESWGHFPVSKKRLLDLVEATRPRKPVFISGDVHFAELFEKYVPQGLVEFTSSSLTHSVMTHNYLATVLAYPVYLRLKEYIYRNNNFGALEFNYNEQNGKSSYTKLF
uniref:PhoD-like phosphatase, putative n=1 Tax=Theileria annulata TaxID=5874 RepID=A0A3B0MSA0_THEAN